MDFRLNIDLMLTEIIMRFFFLQNKGVRSHRREREEGDGEHGEAGGHDLACPGQRHRVPVPDGRHRDLRRYCHYG